MSSGPELICVMPGSATLSIHSHSAEVEIFHSACVCRGRRTWSTSGLGRTDFSVEPRLLRRGLLESDCAELEVSGAHAAAVDLLPPIHTDPFDRILVAQAQIEGITLLTTDEIVGRYPGPIRAL